MAFAFWRPLFNPKLPGDMSAHEGSDFPDLYEAGIAELQRGLDKGQFTSVDLVKVGPIQSSSPCCPMRSLGILCAD